MQDFAGMFDLETENPELIVASSGSKACRKIMTAVIQSNQRTCRHNYEIEQYPISIRSLLTFPINGCHAYQSERSEKF